MADPTAVLRVAKILARATSPEPHEAATALEHAYKRMVRDQVTLADLLTLPESELFQETLVRLVDVILNHQAALSLPARRAAYAEYMRLIVAKFSGSGAGTAESSSAGEKTREEEARAYRSRHGYDHGTPRDDDESFSQETDKTTKRENFSSIRWPTLPPILVHVWGNVRPWFQRGGVVWFCFHEPVIMSRILAAGILWGMAFAVVVMTVAALGHILTDTKPLFDVSLQGLFSFLTAVGAVWHSRQLLQRLRS